MANLKQTIKTGRERWKSVTPDFWRTVGWASSFLLGALVYVQTLPGIPKWLQITICIIIAGLGRAMAQFGSSDHDLNKK